MRTALSLFVALLLSSAPSAQTLSGQLGDTDPTRDNGAHYEIHEINVEMHEQISISMQSDDFDTYLIVRGPDGGEWINDDFEGDRNAYVEMIAEDGGTYTIWASGFGAQDMGEYTVTVDRMGVVEMDVTEGRLDYKDDQTIKGEFVDMHSIELAAGGTYVIELVSLGFDGFLYLKSPSGEEWRNDDAGTTSLSRIGPVEGESGTWTVGITTIQANGVGAYDLRVITRAD
ncbi:MAG: hypothetical protein Rubg2KO_19540 [Rubricoccaceae bacterium]